MTAPVPPGATEYILNELTRRLNDVAGRLESGLSRLDHVYVRKDVYDQWQITAAGEHLRLDDQCKNAVQMSDAAAKVLTDRVTALEESRQWLFRLCAGALVTAVISAVVALMFAVKP